LEFLVLAGFKERLSGFAFILSEELVMFSPLLPVF